jgi:hypothetical protein
MDKFNEWWGKGKGSEEWARVIDKDILGAIKVAFNAGVASGEKQSGRVAALREARAAVASVTQHFPLFMPSGVIDRKFTLTMIDVLIAKE